MLHVQDAVTEYTYAVLDLSADTQSWYTQKLRRFVSWLEADRDSKGYPGPYAVDSIKPSDVSRFLDEFSRAPVARTGKLPSSYTVHGYAQVVKGFLNWCGREDYVPDRLGSRIKMPRVDEKIIETFSKEQIKRLLLACDEESYPMLKVRAKAIVATLLGTGIRSNELCGLTMSGLHLDHHDAYIKVMGKGRREREVGLPNSAVKYIQRYTHRYRTAPEWVTNVFVGHKREAMVPNGVDHLFYRLRERGKITGVRCSPHTCRHTFAVNFLLNGGDVYTLSRILGHSNVTTTEIYLRAMKSTEIRKSASSVLDMLQ